MTKKDDLSQVKLKTMLSYDPETGVFTSKIKIGNKAANSVMGCSNSKGYVFITIEGRTYSAHRLAYFYMRGFWPPNYIDHINNIKSDNSFRNLRLATSRQNSLNCGLRKSNTSGHKGVDWFKHLNKWRAKGRDSTGKIITIGYFTSLSTAAQAYQDFAKLTHGQFYNRGA